MTDVASQSRVGVFLAGVQKGGTTALFKHMAAHTSLVAPFMKETHHFDNELLDWSQDQADRLGTFYPGWDDSRLRFEATPITFYWPPSLRRVHAYNPAAKLIVLFRDPIERAYSHWRMEVLRGTEPLPFADAIRGGRTRLQAARPLDANWRDRSYVERGFYGDQLERALSLFPRSQMLLLLSEEFRTRHQSVLDRVTEFLGIPVFGDVPCRTANQAAPEPHLPPISQADRRELQSVFASDMRKFAALSGLDIGQWKMNMSSNDVPVR